MTNRHSATALHHLGAVLAAAMLVGAAGLATAQADHRFQGHNGGFQGFHQGSHQGRVVVSAPHNHGFSLPNFRGPRLINWLAHEKPLGWHLRNSNAFPRQYTHEVKPLLANMPADWQRRMHAQNHNWYHNWVRPGHRLVPGFGNDHRGHGRVIARSRAPAHAAVHQPHPGSHQHSAHRTTSGHNVQRGRNCSIGIGTLLGAAAGGFIGSQIGNGSGQLAATAAGTFLGATLGSQANCN